MTTPNQHPIKRALISVSDKSGIVELAKELIALNIEIISTGGTLRTLQENGVEATGISDVTGFPEIMDGRVKTLHPAIHSALLADLGKLDHQEQMADLGFSSIDLVVVNLYPFEETLKAGRTHDELIEKIDIGGPAMLRASAKNYKWTLTVTDPSDYDELIQTLKDNNCTADLDLRKRYATKVFSLTAYYDSMISNYFKVEQNFDFYDKLNIGLNKEYDLRYGENPAQRAALYGNFSSIFKKLHGKDLSYNNIVDIDAAAKLVIEFEESPACAIIKHTNPSGVGVGSSLKEAYEKAFATDNVSPFGGIFAFNRELDLETAETIHKIFSEVVIAPSFTEEALKLLQAKKDRRLIEMDVEQLNASKNIDYKTVAGGILAQDHDKDLIDKDNMKVVTDRQPTDDEWQALMFAWRVSKHVKSNAIVYCSKDRTLGVGAGQMSRVDSARIARSKAQEMGIDLVGSVLASDAFFPFADGLEMAADAGAIAVIQPGGSIRDNEVIDAANEKNIAMVFTGMRHFKH